MRKIYYMFVFMLLITVLTSGAPTQKDLLLKIVMQDQAWSDSNLDKKIITELSRRSDIRIQLVSQQEPQEPRYPDDIYDLDSLTNWGREKGARYLMQIELSSQHFEKRKTFHIPLVAHKYETIGVVEGEMRFIDLMQGKLLAAEPFQIEEKGAQIFQATMDDDINDPDLHLTASDKIRFFDRLEQKLSHKLSRRVIALMGNR